MKKIFLVSDDNYVNHLMITINSILSKCSNPKEIGIYILDGGITEKNKSKILNKVGYYKNVQFKKVNMKKYENLKKIGIWGAVAYYRLEITKMFPEEKIVYLDCDMIVKSDILDIFKINLDGKTIGAVKDYFISLVEKENYFNSGMLLIDCKKWAEKKYTKKFFDWYSKNEEKIRYPDQDALNGILKDDWKKLPLEWNRQRILLEFSPKRFGLSKKTYQHLKEDPKIIHYTGRVKPWHRRYIFSDKKDYVYHSRKLGIYKREKYNLGDISYRLLRKIVQIFKLRYFLEKKGFVPKIFVKNEKTN